MADQIHDAAGQYVKVLHELVRELRADVKELRDSKADKTSIRNLRDDIGRLEAAIKALTGEPPTLIQLGTQQQTISAKVWVIFGALNLAGAGFVAWAANGFPVP